MTWEALLVLIPAPAPAVLGVVLDEYWLTSPGGAMFSSHTPCPGHAGAHVCPPLGSSGRPAASLGKDGFLLPWTSYWFHLPWTPPRHVLSRCIFSNLFPYFIQHLYGTHHLLIVCVLHVWKHLWFLLMKFQNLQKNTAFYSFLTKSKPSGIVTIITVASHYCRVMLNEYLWKWQNGCVNWGDHWKETWTIFCVFKSSS